MSRNVEALYELLQLASVRSKEPGEQMVNREMARFLTSRGVLAVDSLTDEQCENEIAQTAVDAEEVRAALRRCATGKETE